jgi:hypothetical protein
MCDMHALECVRHLRSLGDVCDASQQSNVVFYDDIGSIMLSSF